MQQLGYFSLFIARELRIEDVNTFQASKALRNCTMRVLKQKHQPFVSALTLCHTGQCKRTGGCYNELVVAFYSTGGGVKGKKIYTC